MKIKLFWTIIILAFYVFFFAVSVLTQNGGGDGGEIQIQIPKGSSADQISRILCDSSVIKNRFYFRFSVYLLRKQNKLQSGEYLLSSKLTNYAIIDKIARGQTIPPFELKATFPEGSSIYKMSMILKEKKYHNFAQFGNLTNTFFIAEFKNEFAFLKDVPGFSLEGYLFPDTYIFPQNLEENILSKLMLKRFREKIIPFWEASSKFAKYNLHQIITLASIIEKEAKKPEERVIISSVFYNRLKIDMPLAADPTIKYALEDPTKKVYTDQLNVQSPYNTYRNKGFPPGPICNPGLESIKAAVYPAKTNYYYFVAKKDGSHIFSKTWAEHQRAREKTAIPTR